MKEMLQFVYVSIIPVMLGLYLLVCMMVLILFIYLQVKLSIVSRRLISIRPAGLINECVRLEEEFNILSEKASHYWSLFISLFIVLLLAYFTIEVFKALAIFLI